MFCDDEIRQAKPPRQLLHSEAAHSQYDTSSMHKSRMGEYIYTTNVVSSIRLNPASATHQTHDNTQALDCYLYTIVTPTAELTGCSQ